MTEKYTQQPGENSPVANESERREFLKKLGRYSAFASVATVTLMTASKRSAASEIGEGDLPPGGPGSGG